jgi:phage host-nuclease inhibitor protein Gam
VGDRERWKITDASSADWALRKLAQARKRIGENDALADAEMDRIDDWRREANKPHKGDVEYFEGLLRQWHEEQLAEDPKRKTVSLPGGKLEARQNPDHIAIEDTNLAIKWALENHPSWVRVKYELEKDAIKKAGGVVPETGEIAPGVSVVVAPIYKLVAFLLRLVLVGECREQHYASTSRPAHSSSTYSSDFGSMNSKRKRW